MALAPASPRSYRENRMGNRPRPWRFLTHYRTPTSMRRAVAAISASFVASTLFLGTPGFGQSLGGSASSLDRQNAQARAHGFTYLETPTRVHSFVDDGYLVSVRPNRDFELHQVSFPYTRPEIRVFVERLARQYRSACGEKLVITSLTRPLSDQPRNASDRSVHPTGMAVDLRRSNRSVCRTWLEATLLSLEGKGVLEATRERRPPHYHLAVYPEVYGRYLAVLIGAPDAVTAQIEEPPAEIPTVRTPPEVAEPLLRAGAEVEGSDSGSSPSIETATHTVSRGESLWTIARLYGVDEVSLRRFNRLSGDRILPGQELIVSNYGGAAPVKSFEHTVSRGESLWTIARAYRVSENAIRAVNGIRGSRILEGQVLTVPTQGGKGILQHTVSRGESLWTIANAHGTTVEALRSTNGIQTSRIYTGQVLNVPLTF